MGTAPSYRYVGPAVLAEHARPGPGVITVTSAHVLARWLAARPADELSEPFTFVVSLDGQLRLAPRRSEHVDCAAGQPVLAAGEVLFRGTAACSTVYGTCTARVMAVGSSDTVALP